MLFFKKKKRIFVIGLDGVPFTFLKNNIDKFSFFKELFREGELKRMNSVYPTLSSVAWTSFLTGKKPGSHSIYGFIDVKDDLSLFIPNYTSINSKTLIEIFSENEKKVLNINLPITYPPPKLKNVFTISGFLAPNIEKGSFPEYVKDYLKKIDYIIDLDPWMARKEEKREEFYKKLFDATEKRFDVVNYLLKREKFDLIILHIMEPDRLFHFFIKDDNKVNNYFKFLEQKLEEFVKKNVKDEDILILLSDHGFTHLKKEINLFPLLKEKGFFKFEGERGENLKDISSDSKVFTLTPGRIYFFKKERFVKAKFSEKEIREEFEGFIDELSKLEGVKKVFKKEEVFGDEPLDSPPDYLLVPKNGYDFRADFKNEEVFLTSALEGTHTFDDAFLFIRGKNIKKETPELTDVAPTILSLSEIENDYKFDGEVIV